MAHQNNCAAFLSMLDAVGFVMGGDAGHYFILTEDAETVATDVGGVEANEVTPLIASTLAEYAVAADTVVGVSVDSECHFGSILAHYTTNGEIVRFVAIR